MAALAVVAIAAAIAVYASRDDDLGRPSGPFIDGVVVEVESRGLTTVDGFTLQPVDQERLRFGLARLQNATAFPPGHLGEHVSTSMPVRVWYEETAAGLEAIWIEDVPGSPGAS